MKRLAVVGMAGSVLAGLAAVVAGPARLHLAAANIRRYSMPGAGIYDSVAGWLFRDRYGAIARELAGELPAGSKVLDVGCGPAEVLVRLAQLSPTLELTGLDVDAPMIERAERKAKHLPGAATKPSFVVADVVAMPFADASFDVVISSFAVHHWPDRHAGLAEVMRVLRPGGRAIIWDIAAPMDDPHAAPHDAPAAHGAPVAHGSHGATGRVVVRADGSRPTLGPIGMLRMLLLFRRLPSERYDFVKPQAVV